MLKFRFLFIFYLYTSNANCCLEYAYKGYINAEKYLSEGLGYSSNLNTNICTMFLPIVPNYVQKRR